MSLLPVFSPVAPPTVAFIPSSNLDDPTNGQSTYTFVAVPLGAAQSDRRIILGFTGGISNRTVSSVTIGGVSATAIPNATVTASSQPTSALYIATVPTGTTGNVVITWSGLQNFTSIAAWRATGEFTNLDGDSSVTSPGTFTLTTAPGGFVVAYSGWCNGSPTHTWTNLTKNFESASDGTSTQSGASAATTGTSLTVTDTYSGGTLQSLVGASFG